MRAPALVRPALGKGRLETVGIGVGAPRGFCEMLNVSTPVRGSEGRALAWASLEGVAESVSAGEGVAGGEDVALPRV